MIEPQYQPGDQHSEAGAYRRRWGTLNRLDRWRNLLRRHWWIVVACALVSAGIQAWLWHLETPLYTSSGRMIVNLKLSIPEGSLYTEELNNFLGTQAALMQSPVVVERARGRASDRSAELDPPPVSLKVLIQPKTTLFIVQGTGASPSYTAAFVQACMEEYIELKKEMRAQTSDTTLAGLGEELTRLTRELRQCDRELAEFETSNSVVLLEQQGNTAATFLAALEQRAAAARSDYALLSALTPEQALQRQKPLGSSSGPAVAATSRMVASATELAGSSYERLQEEVLLLKSEQSEMAQTLKPKHPKMIALAEEIARRERLVSILREQARCELQRRREGLATEIASLDEQIAGWRAKALEAGRKSAEFQRLKANSQRTQALYDRLVAATQTLDVSKQISPESVTMMEKAGPAVRVKTPLARRLLLVLGPGLALAGLLLLAVERFDDRLNSVADLEAVFPESVLGQVPLEASLAGEARPTLLESHDERYGLQEAYRNLRSSLLFIADEKDRPRSVVVTSSEPNEGKSLTAANLAITVANAGQRVLLVDADLRRGTLHERFGLGAELTGLSDALADEGGARWQSVVVPTSTPNLLLLPRGKATVRCSELFLAATTKKFLAEASKEYDLVILDTAPVMAADDAASLAPEADGVLFVIRAEQTSARVARAALDLLEQRGVNVLGLVFNAVRPGTADYHSYYGYRDYHLLQKETKSNG